MAQPERPVNIQQSIEDDGTPGIVIGTASYLASAVGMKPGEARKPEPIDVGDMDHTYESSEAPKKMRESEKAKGTKAHPGKQEYADRDDDVSVKSEPSSRTAESSLVSHVAVEDDFRNQPNTTTGSAERVKAQMEQKKIAEGEGGLSMMERVKGAVGSTFGAAKAMEKGPEQPQRTVCADAQTSADAGPQGGWMKAQLRKWGMGKGDGGGTDPHSEVNVNKPTLGQRVMGAAGNATGKAQAMESGPGTSEPVLVPTKVEKQSNVEKLSPFTGPSDGNAAGVLESIPAEDTGGRQASEVRAPGFLGRTKEEFQAAGEALKELVKGHN